MKIRHSYNHQAQDAIFNASASLESKQPENEIMRNEISNETSKGSAVVFHPMKTFSSVRADVQNLCLRWCGGATR